MNAVISQIEMLVRKMQNKEFRNFRNDEIELSEMLTEWMNTLENMTLTKEHQFRDTISALIRAESELEIEKWFAIANELKNMVVNYDHEDMTNVVRLSPDVE